MPTTGVPEPSYYTLVLGGLLTMAGAAVYRRRTPEQD
ncbi:MAG TPA: PEP-CTERM sorting domain-containing protein [Bryobacteraceae bacterium]